MTTLDQPEASVFFFIFLLVNNINMILMFVLLFCFVKKTNKEENSSFWLVQSGYVTCRMPLSAFKF